MVLKLHNFTQPTCSLKALICLAEKWLEWVDGRLMSKNHGHLSD